MPIGPESRIGLVVADRYRLERFVGRGRHGDVYYAKHVTVGRALALKALRRELTSDPTAVARFVQEAQAVAALGHPNVVEVTDAGELPDRTPYLVMEWLEGEPLSAYAKRMGPLPPTRAAEIIAAIAAGLGACHAIGVIHRDLKPDNIVLSRTATGELPKVVDFGLARVTTSSKKLTAHGAVVGDFRYAAPEQLAGGKVDARVDVHALGCIFFELVVGRPPQRGELVAPALGAFGPVAARAFAASPDARFATIMDFRSALLEAANGTSATFAPMSAIPVPRVADATPASKPKRTWLLPVVFATLTLLAAGVGGAALVITRQQGEASAVATEIVAPAPSRAPAAQPTVTSRVRIESEGGALEVRRGERVLGATPLSIPRPVGDDTLTLTLVANGETLESLVLDARSPEVVRVTAPAPTVADAPVAPAPPVPTVQAPVAPTAHGGAARPAAPHAPAAVAPAPAPPPTMSARNEDGMIDPWQ